MDELNSLTRLNYAIRKVLRLHTLFKLWIRGWHQVHRCSMGKIQVGERLGQPLFIPILPFNGRRSSEEELVAASNQAAFCSALSRKFNKDIPAYFFPYFLFFGQFEQGQLVPHWQSAPQRRTSIFGLLKKLECTDISW
jgi:hypothetical protein